jgi:hypothetical protein
MMVKSHRQAINGSIDAELAAGSALTKAQANHNDHNLGQAEKQ